MNYQSFTLNNGIRIIHLHTLSHVAHCGLLINAGSRDEHEHEHGMAHFIEHAIFKGTKKRKAYHILSRMEDVGGEINAYTSKEETAIHTSFLKNDYERAIELIWDITFNSVFPQKEIDREKEVIIEEIKSYKDDPAELIFDEFEELVFRNQPLGKNILGNPKDLRRFTKNDVESFIKNNYHTNEMVLCSIGNISFEKFKKLAEKYFGQIASNPRTKKRALINNYLPEIKTLHKKTHQTHFIIGNLAYNVHDPKKVGLTLLDNMLGGPGLNSRLSLVLREKYGYVYYIESNYTPYSDTGIFSIYFGTDKNNVDKSLSLVKKEFDLLRNKKLGIVQLRKAKKQIFGQIAINSENSANLMLSMGKSFLLFNKVDSLEEIRTKIESITIDDIQKIANEILDIDNMSMLIYK
ncbi:MAG: zinc protease [Bacteroidetes bacterium GWC2_33_15]|nr:MAG: zinc protease [Bacteroidetes bacterium GWA2_33_15]OFX50149.1 MAG: zinc protease [Bacteroidetes bacterium GWC2_33_15]OFX65301.1 MAG: zinc protease [Bacteroidetes bacterium GWB2_32_14]OFX70528.1 MAG: zinc protease [Bacteroidetes bacterium GWD2_33_33]HAN19598.1 peptidase M16 [Bacteroidales bacterium]